MLSIRILVNNLMVFYLLSCIFNRKVVTIKKSIKVILNKEKKDIKKERNVVDVRNYKE